MSGNRLLMVTVRIFTNPVIDMEAGRIEGTDIEVEELSGGRIVYGVENTGKPVVIVLRLMSRTNAKTGMSYRVE